MLFVLLLVLFALCAYFDLKSSEIPDLLSASLWGAMFFFEGDALRFAVGCFVLIFACNSLVYTWRGRELCGWADVLILPPWLGAFYAMAGFSPVGGDIWVVAIAAVIMASGAVELWKHRGGRTPLAPFLFVSYFWAYLWTSIGG